MSEKTTPQNKNISYLLIILLVISALVIGYIAYRNNQKKKEQEKRFKAEMRRLMNGDPRYPQQQPQIHDQPTTEMTVVQDEEESESESDQDNETGVTYEEIEMTPTLIDQSEDIVLMDDIKLDSESITESDSESESIVFDLPKNTPEHELAEESLDSFSVLEEAMEEIEQSETTQDAEEQIEELEEPEPNPAWFTFTLTKDNLLYVQIFDNEITQNMLAENLHKKKIDFRKSVILKSDDSMHLEDAVFNIVDNYALRTLSSHADKSEHVISWKSDSQIEQIIGKTEDGKQFTVDFPSLFGLEPNKKEEDKKIEPITSDDENQEKSTALKQDKKPSQEKAQKNKTDKKTKPQSKVFVMGGTSAVVYAEAKETENIIMKPKPPKDNRMLIGNLIEEVENEDGKWYHIKLKMKNPEGLKKGYIKQNLVEILN